MSKKIILAVFGGIALFGLALGIVGVCLGGRLGSLNIKNEQFVYQEFGGGNTVVLGHAPSWLSNRLPLWARDSHSTASNGMPTGSGTATNATETHQGLPAAEEDLYGVNIDLPAGHLKVVQGDEWGLTVDGSLPYESYFDGSEWNIYSDEGYDISTRGGGRRFWQGNRDITTTFTLVVPSSLPRLDITLGLGTVDLQDLNLAELECEVAAGQVTAKNVMADSAELTVNGGEIVAEEMYALTCALTCDAGNIRYQGNVTNLLEAECNAGNITVTMPRPVDYGWQADVGMGRISLDGNNTAGIGNSSHGGNMASDMFFDLNCGMGNIEVLFN